MKEIYSVHHEKIEEDVSITKNQKVDLYGMIVGNCIVANKSVLILHGIVTKDLTIKDKARVVIYGTVTGTVHTEGGFTYICGKIGQLERGLSGVKLDPRAIFLK